LTTIPIPMNVMIRPTSLLKAGLEARSIGRWLSVGVR
jgi:hypothetical protein